MTEANEGVGFLTRDAADTVDDPVVAERHSTPREMATAITTVIRSAIDEYNLVGRDVANVLNVSPSFVSRLHRQNSSLAADSNEFERAVLFVRALDALGSMIGPPTQVREFLYGPHKTLGAPPIKVMQTLEGLVDVTRYFESLSH